MKLSFTIKPSLPEGMYRVLIEKVDDAPVNESASSKYDDVLRRINFKVLGKANLSTVAVAPAAPDNKFIAEAMKEAEGHTEANVADVKPEPKPAKIDRKAQDPAFIGYTDQLIVWPQRAKWIYQQLVDKCGLKSMEDDQELVGQVLDLFYSHSYEDRDSGNIVLKKQWKLYENQD